MDRKKGLNRVHHLSGGLAALVGLLLLSAAAEALTFPASGYTTIITDPVDPAVDPCRDILAIGYQQDGTNSYFSFTVNCSNVGFNNQRYSLFVDADLDGDNDYLIWMENPQVVDIYAWSTTGCPDPTRSCWLDQNSPTAAFQDPNLVPDDSVFLGVASAEIGYPNGFVVGASTATANVKLDIYCNAPGCQNSGDSTGSGEIGVAFLGIDPATVCIGVASTVTASRTDSRAVTATFTWIDASLTTRFTDAGVTFVSGLASSTRTPPDNEGFWKIEARYYDAGGVLLPSISPGERDEIFLQVQGPTAAAGNDRALCLGGSATLGGAPTAFGGTAPYSYAWSPTNGLDNAAVANPSASPSSTTTYVVTVTDANGCSRTDSVLVTVRSLPQAAAGNDTGLCLGSAIILGGVPTGSGGTGPYTYAWSPASDVDDPSAANPTAQPTVSTTFSVTVTDANGCSASDSVAITLQTCNPDLLRRIAFPELRMPDHVEASNFTSGGAFPNEVLDLTDDTRTPIFYRVTSAIDTVRVTKSGGKIVITY